VDAPEALGLVLSQIGLVSDEAQGHALMDQLQCGQALVARDGSYWRWDGFFARADAKDRNAQHLEQKNKLERLQTDLPSLEAKAEETRKAYDAAQEELSQIDVKLKSLKNDLRVAENMLSSKQIEMAREKEQRARSDSEISHLKDAIRLADEDIKTLEDVLKWDRERLSALDDKSDAGNEEDLAQVKEELDAKRSDYQDAVRAYDQLVQRQNSLEARLRAIADERVNANNRQIRSRERIKGFEERLEGLHEKLAELEAAPVSEDTEKNGLLEVISGLEATRTAAAERLAEAEKSVYESGKALKEAENALGDAREKRAHVQATLSGLQEQKDNMCSAIEEQFQCEPEELKEHITMKMDDVDLTALRSEKEKLTIERERMGPVNLRAEDEVKELEQEVGGMFAERDDLIQAISELRGGINKINKEARERLIVAFDKVNAHFQELFQKLFVGGKAHLELIGSDDPLEAGLEIFAQPPGKALQSLSLLSGGEQTMASIALIFGMFLTNPSPICVLDEIDAPLDDANVDRVCNLLEDIAARGETRFLIITHHRMTMARMNRLYGVTMQERGVSQLVSVDLQRSFEFAEAA
jgi:chromosome segregation protein